MFSDIAPELFAENLEKFFKEFQQQYPNGIRTYCKPQELCNGQSSVPEMRKLERYLQERALLLENIESTIANQPNPTLLLNCALCESNQGGLSDELTQFLVHKLRQNKTFANTKIKRAYFTLSGMITQFKQTIFQHITAFIQKESFVVVVTMKTGNTAKQTTENHKFILDPQFNIFCRYTEYKQRLAELKLTFDNIRFMPVTADSVLETTIARFVKTSSTANAASLLTQETKESPMLPKPSEPVTEENLRKKHSDPDEKPPAATPLKTSAVKDINQQLRQAASDGNVEEVKRLLREGADINSTSDPSNANYSGRTALHNAAAKGHAEVVTFLLEQKANSTLTDKNHNTPAQLSKDIKIRELFKNVAPASIKKNPPIPPTSSTEKTPREKLEAVFKEFLAEYTFRHNKFCNISEFLNSKASPEAEKEIKDFYTKVDATTTAIKSWLQQFIDKKPLSLSVISSVVCEHLKGGKTEDLIFRLAHKLIDRYPKILIKQFKLMGKSQKKSTLYINHRVITIELEGKSFLLDPEFEIFCPYLEYPTKINNLDCSMSPMDTPASSGTANINNNDEKSINEIASIYKITLQSTAATPKEVKVQPKEPVTEKELRKHFDKFLYDYPKRLHAICPLDKILNKTFSPKEEEKYSFLKQDFESATKDVTKFISEKYPNEKIDTKRFGSFIGSVVCEHFRGGQTFDLIQRFIDKLIYHFNFPVNQGIEVQEGTLKSIGKKILTSLPHGIIIINKNKNIPGLKDTFCIDLELNIFCLHSEYKKELQKMNCSFSLKRFHIPVADSAINSDAAVREMATSYKESLKTKTANPPPTDDTKLEDDRAKTKKKKKHPKKAQPPQPAAATPASATTSPAPVLTSAALPKPPENPPTTENRPKSETDNPVAVEEATASSSSTDPKSLPPQAPSSAPTAPAAAITLSPSNDSKPVGSDKKASASGISAATKKHNFLQALESTIYPLIMQEITRKADIAYWYKAGTRHLCKSVIGKFIIDPENRSLIDKATFDMSLHYFIQAIRWDLQTYINMINPVLTHKYNTQQSSTESAAAANPAQVNVTLSAQNNTDAFSINNIFTLKHKQLKHFVAILKEQVRQLCYEEADTGWDCWGYLKEWGTATASATTLCQTVIGRFIIDSALAKPIGNYNSDLKFNDFISGIDEVTANLSKELSNYILQRIRKEKSAENTTTDSTTTVTLAQDNNAGELPAIPDSFAEPTATIDNMPPQQLSTASVYPQQVQQPEETKLPTSYPQAPFYPPFNPTMGIMPGFPPPRFVRVAPMPPPPMSAMFPNQPVVMPSPEYLQEEQKFFPRPFQQHIPPYPGSVPQHPTQQFPAPAWHRAPPAYPPAMLMPQFHGPMFAATGAPPPQQGPMRPQGPMGPQVVMMPAPNPDYPAPR